MSEEFSLDRETNIKHNVDATGKRWEVKTERGRHLFYAHPANGQVNTPIPPKLQGMFTKKMYVDNAIKEHVLQSWEHADQVAAKNARKAQAAKEAKSKES